MKRFNCRAMKLRKEYFLFFIIVLFSLNLLAQPTITSFSPASGPVGTTVTINGSNFSSTPANNIVFFGAVRATVSGASATSLTVSVPVGATYQPITVTVNSLTAYSAKPFVVTFPGGAAMTQNPDQSQNSFEEEIDSTTDLHPNGVAISDLDGDGKPDLATPNNYSITGSPASISILRNISNNGAIAFAPRQDISSGVETYSIAAGDLNGDGKPDLISGSILDGISVFKNTSVVGSISFAPKINYTTGDSPYCIAIADIDGDGKPEMIVLNYFASTVSVYKNTSFGGMISFASKIDFTTGLAPHFVAACDLDGDGKSDLAIANEFSNSVSVLKNTSVGGVISFASQIEFAAGGSPYGVAIGDLDGDGKQDLAVANNGSNNFSILRNICSIGVINFAPKKDFATGFSPYSISIGDLNGDGKPDVVVPSFNLSVSQNTSTTGNIAFDNMIFLFPSQTSYIVSIGDLSGDGKDDLAGANFSGESVSLMRNKNNEPTIRSFSPATAGNGATVTITGVNFTGTTAVSFGGIPAQSFTVVNSTTITAVVGNSISGDVSVTNPYGKGIKSGFIFAGPPTISSFTPTSAAQGAAVTITGTNFSGATAVSFGGVAAQSFTIISPTRISAKPGAGASGNVSVTNPYGTGTLGGFIILPAITSFSPTSAATGATVTITGTNLTGTTAVSFGGVSAASFNVVSATSITAIVGNGASGAITVTNPNGTATLAGFTYIPPPAIISFVPTSAGTGTTVTITGVNFSGATAISFGGTAATTFTVVSPTTITAVVGTGMSGSISITTPGGIATLGGFTYIPPPTISSFTPSTTGAGATVTITGTNFLGTTTVSFGGVPASSFNVVSPTTITAVVGTAASGTVSVITPGGTATVNGFTYTTLPIINAFSPTSGPVGTTVTIGGANFGATPSDNVIYFGPVRATISAATTNSLTVVVPPGASYQPISVSTRNLTAYSNQPFIVTFPGGGPFTSTTFAGRVDFNAGKNPSDIATGDFDNDGKPDLITSNFWSGSISAFRNTGGSGILSFADKIDFEAGHNPHNLAVGDIDGDGKLDIVLLNSHPSGGLGQDTLSVFKNISTPGIISFAQRLTFLTGFIPADVAIVDLNNDRMPDLVVTNDGNESISIFRNNSSGGIISFVAQPPVNLINGTNLHYVTNIAVGDLNSDGKPDIVIGKSDATYLTILRNTGSGSSISFNVSFFGNLIGSGSFDNVSITDFDKDGKPDVITDDYLFRNTSTAISGINFSLTRIIHIGGRGCIEDLNGDAKPDFAKIDAIAPSTVTVLRNTGSPGTFSLNADASYPTGTTPWGIVAGDFDFDGLPDLATANYDLNNISILKNVFGYSGPLISSFTPDTALAGTTVVITGSNLTGATAVSFGGVPASTFTVNSSTSITAVVGTGASGNVSVTTPSGTTSLAWFTLIPPPPTIVSFTPASSGAGSEVTITGTNFSEVTAVSFGGIAITSFTVNSPTNITAVVGAGASGNVSVTTLGGTASLAGFTFIPAPTITSFTPTSAATGVTVTITGTNFTGATAVSFGGVAASSFTVVNSTTITAVVGTGSSGGVSVTTPGGTTTKTGFTFIPAPAIASFTPTSVATGGTVTITGTNFTGATSVSFGGITATSFVVNSSTSITAVVGTGASGDVSVTTPGGTATKSGFTFSVATAVGNVIGNSLELKLYPNPAKDYLIIEHPITNKSAKIEWIDISGRIIKTVSVKRNETKTNVNTQTLYQGVYKIIWTDGKNSLTKTVMILK